MNPPETEAMDPSSSWLSPQDALLYKLSQKISWEGQDFFRYRICPKNWILHDITSPNDIRPPCSVDLNDITKGNGDVKASFLQWATSLDKVDKESGTLKMPLGSLEMRLNDALGRIQALEAQLQHKKHLNKKKRKRELSPCTWHKEMKISIKKEKLGKLEQAETGSCSSQEEQQGDVVISVQKKDIEKGEVEKEKKSESCKNKKKRK